MESSFHQKDIATSSFLVTGGAGFIGSHIAEYLLRMGAGKVRVMDNMVNGFESNLDLLRKYDAFEFIQADIRDAAACLLACDKIDFISHQAALGSVPRSMKEPSLFNTQPLKHTILITSSLCYPLCCLSRPVPLLPGRCPGHADCGP